MAKRQQNIDRLQSRGGMDSMFETRGLASQNLSRLAADSATVTSPLFGPAEAALFGIIVLGAIAGVVSLATGFIHV